MGLEMKETYQERGTTEGKESFQTAMQCWNPWKKRKEEDWVGRAFVHTSNKVLVKPMASPWAKDAFEKIPTSHSNGPASIPPLSEDTDIPVPNAVLSLGGPCSYKASSACMQAKSSFCAILPCVFIVSNYDSDPRNKFPVSRRFSWVTKTERDNLKIKHQIRWFKVHWRK